MTIPRHYALSFAMFALVAGCTKQRAVTPEGVVEEFVRLSAGAEEPGAQQALRDLCAGDVRSLLEEMPAEVFRISYLNNGVKLKTLQFVNSKVEGEQATVEYEVEVENTMGKQPTEEHVRREVGLKLTEGKWQILTIKTQGNDRITFKQGMVF